MKALTALALVVVVLYVVSLVVFRMPIFGGSFAGSRLDRMQASPSYTDGRFENSPPQDGYDFAKFKTMIGNYLGDQVRTPVVQVPVVSLSASDFGSPSGGLRAWWFGHSSVLVEVDGMRVMTDPVFAERASPLSFVGPRRFHPAPLSLAQMPAVDAVVISHDHFDHLDMAAVQAFAARGTHFYVGLGVGAHLERWNVPAAQIHEMAWWDSETLGSITIHALPARHYSGRKSMDNSTLWASWAIKGAEHAVYYTGDTGYAEHFAEIGDRLGPFDISLTKVGSYGDSWVDIHMDPESAVRAHLDLRARVLLPLHWATFNMSYHAWDEPIERTLRAAHASGVDVTTPRIGQVIEIGMPLPADRWWRH